MLDSVKLGLILHPAARRDSFSGMFSHAGPPLWYALTPSRAAVADGFIARAVRVLRAGELVAFPTYTYYGLGADVLNEAAVRRGFAAKGRDDGRPLPVLIAGLEDALKVALEFPEPARKLASRYWPGPLTIVLPKRPELPFAVTVGGDSVGLRVPEHEVPRRLVRALGRPITGTSANRSGSPPHKDADGVRADLGDWVELVLAGTCGPHDAPSTVVDFTGRTPVIIRPGAISVAEIQAILPDAASPLPAGEGSG